MADLESPQTKRDKGKAVDRLAICPAVHFFLKPTNKLVEKSIKMLLSVKLICQIELAWVRGHSGVTGNEVVDGMAKENTIAVQLSSPALARTEIEIKNKIKRFAEHKWQQCWRTISHH